MSAWSAKILQPGYPRSIVGFDLRVLVEKRPDVLNAVSTDADLPSVGPVTIDPEVWQRNAEDKPEDERNGFNLLDAPSDNLLSFWSNVGGIRFASLTDR
jgi:hypothetical protein